MQQAKPPAALVVGASGAIGGAVMAAFAQDTRFDRVVAISRSKATAQPSDVTWLQTDHSEPSLQQLADELDALDLDLQRVALCTGVLHGETLASDAFKPEKMLEHLDAERVTRRNGDVREILV